MTLTEHDPSSLTSCALIEVPMKLRCRAIVVIPARDEAKHLAPALDCFTRQVNICGKPLPLDTFEILLLANNCSDGTAAVARDFAAVHCGLSLHVIDLHLPPDMANVGFARKLLMDQAIVRLKERGQIDARCAILSTDADSKVAPDWIAANLAEIDLGADAVGGRIYFNEEEFRLLPRHVRKTHLRDTAYRLLTAQLESILDPSAHDDWPRHHQHFGASLAIAADAYLAAGGLPPVKTLEDVAMIRILLQRDGKIRHSPRVRVWTSARMIGRVQLGLSSQLEEWDDLQTTWTVDSPSFLVQYFEKRRVLREVWRTRDYDSARGFDRSELRECFDRNAAFGEALQELDLESRVAKDFQRSMPVSEAIEQMRALLRARPWSNTSAQFPVPCPQPLFKSFLIGGFECSSHINGAGVRLDMIASTGHDLRAESDYRQLNSLGIRTARDGFRWHLIDCGNYYNFESLKPMVEASERTSTQMIWDLCHYGWPEDIHPLHPDFIERFRDFSFAIARFFKGRSVSEFFCCPINEISFLTWSIGRGGMHPYIQGRDRELKCALVSATMRAMDAIRAELPAARFVQCEPLIHVVTPEANTCQVLSAEVAQHNSAQYETWDLLSGRDSAVGGQESYIDILGGNFYPFCQWEYQPGFPNRTLLPEDPRWRPLNQILTSVSRRYGKPILLAETSHEAEDRVPWIQYVVNEVQTARRQGTDVRGLCIYPVIDRHDWDIPTLWHKSGVWDLHIASDGSWRWHLHENYAHRIRQASRAFRP